MRTRTVSLAIMLLVLVPHFTCATPAEGKWENLAQLRVGQKIEVIDMKLKSVRGTFQAHSNEWISLRVNQNEVLIDRRDVFRVTNTERSHRLRNALLGLLIGAGGGAAAGGIIVSSIADESETAAGAVVGGMVGMGVGAGLGAVLPSPVTVYRASVRVAKVRSDSLR